MQFEARKSLVYDVLNTEFALSDSNVNTLSRLCSCEFQRVKGEDRGGGGGVIVRLMMKLK